MNNLSIRLYLPRLCPNIAQGFAVLARPRNSMIALESFSGKKKLSRSRN